MGKKKKSKPQVVINSTDGDWRKKLGQVKRQMEINMTPEEKAKAREERIEEQRRLDTLARVKPGIYRFLAGYKQNSGIFINNFFRNRDFETYCADKFHIFDFEVCGLMPNLFDNPVLSMAMVRYLGKLDAEQIAYFPIDENFILNLIDLAEGLEVLPKTNEEVTLYRGCTNLDRNGVNGIVSTSSDFKIAEQFSRGTILTIKVPKGTPYLNVRGIRPHEQQEKDTENEVLLPPCDYEIVEEVITKKGKEPNNLTGKTHRITISVSPKDLLEEFLAVMENPPKDYAAVSMMQGAEYVIALDRLREYVEKRRKKQQSLVRGKKGVPSTPQN